MAPGDAAVYLDVSVDALAKFERTDPDFPVHRLGRGPRAHRRYYAAELDAWLRNRCSTGNRDDTTAEGAA